MGVLRIDHLGIAVASHTEARGLYETLLGLRRADVEDVPTQKVRVAFYPCAGVNFELLESTDPEGPVGKFLSRRGEGFHHVAFEVDNLEAELARLQRAQVELIDVRPRPGSHKSRIAFLHPRSTRGVLVELVERPQGSA